MANRLTNKTVALPRSACCRHIADDGLAARMNMDVLNAHHLLAAAAQFRQRFDLRRVGPQQLHSEAARTVNLIDLIHAACAP
jgi:hypothetical protein